MNELKARMNEKLKLAIKQYVEDAHYSRGKYLHSYSEVEYLLLDIINKVRELFVYNSINFKFESSVKGRVKLIRQLIIADGPLQQFFPQLSGICDKLEDHQELRQFLAHGLLRMSYSDNQNFSLTFLRYNPKNKSNLWEPEIAKFHNSEFKNTVNIASEELSECMINARDIYDNLNFEGEKSLSKIKSLDDV